MKYLIALSLLVTAACSSEVEDTQPIQNTIAPTGETPPPDQPPATPPEPENTLPVLKIAIPLTQVDERQPIQIYTEGSLDEDGDALSFKLELGDTPYVDIEPISDPSGWIVTTGEVAETTSFPLTVSVTDGKDTVSETRTVTIENFDRTPINNTWLPSSSEFEVAKNGSASFADNSANSGFQTAHVLRTSETDQLEVLEFSFFNGFPEPDTIPLNIPAPRDATLETATVQSVSGPRSFSITSIEDETVRIFRREGQSSVSLTGTLNLPGLCSTAWAYVKLAPDGRLLPSLFTGTQNGLWIFMNEGARERFSSQAGEFVETQLQRGHGTGNYCAAGPFSTFFDATQKTFISIEDTTYGAPDFPLFTPVNIPDDLALVSIEAGKLKHQILFYALLFAGEEHTSDHRLVILHRTPSGTIEQLDYHLPNGIPSDLVIQSIDTNFFDLQYGRGEGNRDTDIVISAPETPYVYVVTVEDDGFGGVSFSPIEYFEAGYGVKDIAVEVTDGTNRYSLITNDGTTLRLHKSALEFSRF